MASINAKTSNQQLPPKLVVFVVYPNFVLLDLSGPLQVFTHAQSQDKHQTAYKTAIVSVEGGIVESNTIISIETTAIAELNDQTIHTLIIVGGDGAYDSMHDEILIDNVANLAAAAERVCSVCSGALILAATGILDGLRAVTHWEDCRQLAEEFPKVNVEVDPIFIKEEHIWTSAGITAGMDMALAIIEEDLGRASALEMARSMVTPMVQAVEAIRLETARGLLETTVLGVEEIAGRCGFNDDERMRRAFTRGLNTSPTEYRLRFQTK